MTTSATLERLHPDTRAAQIEFKTSMLLRNTDLSAAVFQIKRGVKPVFDRDLGRNGGWRCPPGTRYAGRWTDKFGTDCGWGVSRRIANQVEAVGANLGRLADDRRDRGVERNDRRRERGVGRENARIDAATRRRDAIQAGASPRDARRAVRGENAADRQERIAARLDAFEARRNEARAGRAERGANRRDRVADRLDAFEARRDQRRASRAERGAGRRERAATRLDEIEARRDERRAGRADRSAQRRERIAARLDAFEARRDERRANRPARRAARAERGAARRERVAAALDRFENRRNERRTARPKRRRTSRARATRQTSRPMPQRTLPARSPQTRPAWARPARVATPTPVRTAAPRPSRAPRPVVDIDGPPRDLSPAPRRPPAARRPRPTPQRREDLEGLNNRELDARLQRAELELAEANNPGPGSTRPAPWQRDLLRTEIDALRAERQRRGRSGRQRINQFQPLSGRNLREAVNEDMGFDDMPYGELRDWEIEDRVEALNARASELDAPGTSEDDKRQAEQLRAGVRQLNNEQMRRRRLTGDAAVLHDAEQRRSAAQSPSRPLARPTRATDADTATPAKPKPAATTPKPKPAAAKPKPTRVATTPAAPPRPVRRRGPRVDAASLNDAQAVKLAKATKVERDRVNAFWASRLSGDVTQDKIDAYVAERSDRAPAYLNTLRANANDWQALTDAVDNLDKLNDVSPTRRSRIVAAANKPQPKRTGAPKRTATAEPKPPAADKVSDEVRRGVAADLRSLGAAETARLARLSDNATGLATVARQAEDRIAAAADRDGDSAAVAYTKRETRKFYEGIRDKANGRIEVLRQATARRAVEDSARQSVSRYQAALDNPARNTDVEEIQAIIENIDDEIQRMDLMRSNPNESVRHGAEAAHAALVAIRANGVQRRDALRQQQAARAASNGVPVDAAKEIAKRVKAKRDKRNKILLDYLKARYGEERPWDDPALNIPATELRRLASSYDSSDRQRLREWAQRVWGHDEVKVKIKQFDPTWRPGDPAPRPFTLVDGVMRSKVSSINGYSVFINIEASTDGGQTWVAAGSSQRDLRVGSASPTVYNALLSLRPEYRGTGFASVYNPQAFMWLRASGFKAVEVSPGLEDGPRVWPLLGFRSKSRDEVRNLSLIMARNLAEYRNGGQSIITNDVDAAIVDALVTRARNVDYSAARSPRHMEFILALSNTESDPDAIKAREKQLDVFWRSVARQDAGVSRGRYGFDDLPPRPRRRAANPTPRAPRSRGTTPAAATAAPEPTAPAAPSAPLRNFPLTVTAREIADTLSAERNGQPVWSNVEIRPGSTIAVQHVTGSESNAQNIVANGFDLNRQSWGRVWGDGIYFGFEGDGASLDMYSSRNRYAGVVSATVTPSRPLIADGESSEEIELALFRALGGDSGVQALRDQYLPEATERLRQGLLDAGLPVTGDPVDSLTSAGAADVAASLGLPTSSYAWGQLERGTYRASLMMVARLAGYDAVVIRQRRHNSGPGGSQIVVFDPSIITMTGARLAG